METIRKYGRYMGPHWNGLVPKMLYPIEHLGHIVQVHRRHEIVFVDASDIEMLEPELMYCVLVEHPACGAAVGGIYPVLLHNDTSHQATLHITEFTSIRVSEHDVVGVRTGQSAFDVIGNVYGRYIDRYGDETFVHVREMREYNDMMGHENAIDLHYEMYIGNTCWEHAFVSRAMARDAIERLHLRPVYEHPDLLWEG